MISPGTATANIPDWRSRIHGAWLIKVGNTIVNSVEDTVAAPQHLVESSLPHVVLSFAHPEIRPNLSHN
jgi:hypothetical protein